MKNKINFIMKLILQIIIFLLIGMLLPFSILTKIFGYGLGAVLGFGFITLISVPYGLLFIYIHNKGDYDEE